MAYPDKINALVDIAGASTLAVVGHAARHNDVNDALDELKVVLTVPAANTLALAPGGTERLRIDSSGNVYGVAAQNLLYNGAMQVAQRATSVAGITASSASYRTVDRYLIACTGTQAITASVENDAPTGSGFRNSSKILVTTAQATPSAGDEMAFFQRLEGQDLQRIKKGTASAEQLTLSFWVKSNVTGTFIAELYDYDNGRDCSKAYTISASGTWEYKTLTFPADTTGALDNDNNTSFHASFFLTAGSNLSSGTLATTWASAAQANRAVGQSNLGAATSNYWQVTGVQLEVGPIASPFQFKTFGQQLRECQRYYYRVTADSTYAYFGLGSAISTTAAKITMAPSVPMRVVPTAIDTPTASTLRAVDGVNATALNASPTLDLDCTNELLTFNLAVASGLTQYRPYWVGANNSTSAYIGFSAEL